ncbi:hypothetical protein [Pseudonocardia lacus]|uniref:hypothetical protein n=1 Tax=Pseudonocardia lacus TaxID=2835865 RepID=UPI001BDC0616|nr:hypothetical protein [Pseudonocardia lacus]
MVAAAACLLVLAGCAGASQPAAPDPAPSAATGAAGAGGVATEPDPSDSFGRRSEDNDYWPRSVQLGLNAQLAEVVVDGDGFTLYRFDDDADPSRSTCSGGCVKKWPPVPVNDRITFRNLDPEQLGAVPRADGTLQLTVGGWPAYRFAEDQVPGQTAGQGVDDKWSVLGPDGSRAGRSRSGSS